MQERVLFCSPPSPSNIRAEINTIYPIFFLHVTKFAKMGKYAAFVICNLQNVLIFWESYVLMFYIEELAKTGFLFIINDSIFNFGLKFHLLFAFKNAIFIPTLIFLSKSWKLKWKKISWFLFGWDVDLQESKANRPWSRLFKFWRSSSVISLASFCRKVFSWKSCGIGIRSDCHPKVDEGSRPATGKQWKLDLSILI